MCPSFHTTASVTTASNQADSDFNLAKLITAPAQLLAHNTMRLSCQAMQLITLEQEAQVEPTIAKLKEGDAPLFVLSGGSNVILPKQLQAQVLHPVFKGIEVLAEDEHSVSLEVMGGENWHELVLYTVNNGWYGLENLALIPGLVGASPVQNIGAYGVQLEDCLTHIKAFHLPTQKWHDFDKADCQFNYRDSLFKQQAGQWLITRVGFKLHKDATQVNADYGDVACLALSLAQADNRSAIGPIDVMHAIIDIRQSKLPDPAVLPNCGSFFKNPIIGTEQFAQLQHEYPGIVGYRVDEAHTKVAAGWLIDTAGLKGQGINPILTHAKQALVLVNHSTLDSTTPASQADILATQQFIQRSIKDKFGIELEREPVWVDEQASYTAAP